VKNEPIPPSGQQFEIRHGQYSLVAVEVGGGIRSFRAGDIEILDGFPVTEMCRDARGDVLMPWPNRLAGGQYTFHGEQEQLALTEPAHHNAIHGLVRWNNWGARTHAESVVVLGHTLHPQTGYPFTLDLSVRYALSETGLEVQMQATNLGAAPCPFGAGQHPYVRLGTPTIDPLKIQIPARSMYHYNDQLIPVEKVSVSHTPMDFRVPRLLGSTQINMDYTDLERDDDGMARVHVVSESTGHRLAVWMDGAFRHVTVYTGETVQPVTRRRHGLAIEPMTCPPNAFVSGEDLLVLDPNETWNGRWGISIEGIQ
jgi:aldose 1-epimerase